MSAKRVEPYCCRTIAAVMVVLCAALVPDLAAAEVEYVDYQATYFKAARQPAVAQLATYWVTADEGSGIDAAKLLIRGLERTDDDPDLSVHVTAERAAIVDARLQNFRGQIAVYYGGQKGPPFFDYVIYWHEVTLAQSATATARFSRAGLPIVTSPPLGATLRRETSKPDAMRTGVFQMRVGPRCVMQNENASDADSAARRANYLVETFATDVTRDGIPLVTNGRARAEALLAEIRKIFEENPRNPLADLTTANINAWLETEFGSGDRVLPLALAVARDDARFNDALATLGPGDAADRSPRRSAAIEALRSVVADARASARARAAAWYNIGALHGLEGRLDDAAEALRLAEIENLKQRDRLLGARHGQALQERIVRLRTELAERNPAAPGGTR